MYRFGKLNVGVTIVFPPCVCVSCVRRACDDEDFEETTNSEEGALGKGETGSTPGRQQRSIRAFFAPKQSAESRLSPNRATSGMCIVFSVGIGVHGEVRFSLTNTLPLDQRLFAHISCRFSLFFCFLSFSLGRFVFVMGRASVKVEGKREEEHCQVRPSAGT
jgi:hypothetical protein